MRSFNSLAFRQVRARRFRALLTTAGIVLGVGMILGVLLLSATISQTFGNLFDSVYGRTDLVVSGKETTGTAVKRSTLRQVRAVDGVKEVSPNILGVFTRVGKGGRTERGPSGQLNVIGIDPDASNLTDAQVTKGREPKSGSEIHVQESWAKGKGIDVGDRVRFATPAGVARLRVVGLFRFSTGLDFGGQGFAAMPIGRARELMDRPSGFDEINIVVDGDQQRIEQVRRELRRRLGKGVEVKTPESKGEEVQSQLQGLNVILYFFAAMALFVGGFLIFNSFNMTVLQRMRELGMLRTLGATRAMIVRSVLLEALLLGVVGAAVGLSLGVGLARVLVLGLREVGFPVGGMELPAYAFVVALATGLATTVFGALYPARRASRVAPIRAVLGAGEGRTRPRPRRALAGLALILPGMAGAYWLGAADETTSLVVAAGMSGTIAVFLGIALLAPFAVGSMVRVLSWPLRKLFPVEGRLAADSARANPSRTAATATGLLIGLALVVAFGTLGSSFLKSISDEFDRSFARDLTVQPRGFSPGEGPQQTIARSLHDRIERIPEAGVVARERMFYLPDFPIGKGDGLVIGFNPDEYGEVDKVETEGVSREEALRRMGRGQVSIGKGAAEEADIGPGDRLTLRGPSGTRRVTVAAVVNTFFFGGQTLSMSLETMRDVYGVTTDSQLAIKATSPEVRPQLQRKIERIVERDYPQLVVLSNEELKADIEERVDQQFGIFYGILGVAIFASLFGIINTLSMSVFERTREIGVLRAIGASRWQVRRAIVNESLIIALIGAVLGVAVGIGLGWALLKGIAAGIPSVSYQPPVATIVSVAILAVVLGLLASILPARRAARLNVIEALNYE